MNKQKKSLLNTSASNQIRELIEDGWEFMLVYGDNSTRCDIKELCWEADFTRQKDDGYWDNHESGYDLCPNEAINKAYNNIKNGVKLKRKILK